VKLFEAEQKQVVFRIVNNPSPPRRPAAFLGVWACELAAIRIQDRVFLNGPYRDPIYQAGRDGVFIVAVQCTHSAATCFCTSMGTARSGVGRRPI
jgi:sulfhydrogenase subunit beta (sulfur reductase)